MKPRINNPNKNKIRLCVNVQTLTDTYTQRNSKHNQNNYRQIQIEFWDDVNPKRRESDVSFI